MSKNLLAILSLSIILISCQKEPQADFNFATSEVTAGDVVRINNNSNDADHYLWTFPGGKTGTATNIDYTPADAGNHSITLKAFSKNGKKADVIVKILTVKEAMGSAVFWVISGTTVAGDIQVTMNGETKIITNYYNSAPECGDTGVPTFELETGIHVFAATDGVRNWNGSVNISKNGCFTMQLY